MKLLISYASNSGSTYLVAKELAKILNADIKKAVDTKVIDFKDYDVILLGSPSWDVNNKEGQPHETMLALLEQIKNSDISGKQFAVFGCGDSSYLKFCGAVTEIENVLKAANAKLLCESLKIDSYYFDLDKNVKKVQKWGEDLNSKIQTTFTHSIVV